jgi:hypothetical protein
MWTRLFRLGAQSTRYDPRSRPRNIANSYKEAVHRCLSLLFRSLIFFCVEDQPRSVLFSPPHLLRSLRCSAPPKPPLDQERLQLIDLSCIKHPGHLRGAYSLCSHQGKLCSTSSLCARQELGSPLFCLAGRRSNITVIPAGREVASTQKDTNFVASGGILSGIYNIALDLRTDWVGHQLNDVREILIEAVHADFPAGLHNISEQPWIATISKTQTEQRSTNS